MQHQGAEEEAHHIKELKRRPLCSSTRSLLRDGEEEFLLSLIAEAKWNHAACALPSSFAARCLSRHMACSSSARAHRARGTGVPWPRPGAASCAPSGPHLLNRVPQPNGESEGREEGEHDGES
uniref:Uncharacterized protein n=1 Tax=Oryza meridionalis TaxID=40149 RepID=A0A0E0EG38_9ORYZ